MTRKFVVAVEPAEYAAAGMMMLRLRWSRQKIAARILKNGAIFSAILVGLYWFDNDAFPAPDRIATDILIGFGIALAVFAGEYLYARWRVTDTVDSRLSGTDRPDLPTTYEFDASGFTFTNEETDYSVVWQDVAFWIEEPDVIVMLESDGHPFIVPKARIASDILAEFREALSGSAARAR